MPAAVAASETGVQMQATNITEESATADDENEVLTEAPVTIASVTNTNTSSSLTNTSSDLLPQPSSIDTLLVDNTQNNNATNETSDQIMQSSNDEVNAATAQEKILLPIAANSTISNIPTLAPPPSSINFTTPSINATTTEKIQSIFDENINDTNTEHEQNKAVTVIGDGTDILVEDTIEDSDAVVRQKKTPMALAEVDFSTMHIALYNKNTNVIFNKALLKW